MLTERTRKPVTETHTREGSTPGTAELEADWDDTGVPLVGPETEISDLKELLLDVRAVFDSDPTSWASGLKRYFEGHAAALEQSPQGYAPNTRQFLERYLPEIIEILAAEEAKLDKAGVHSPIETGLHIIHEISSLIERDTRTREPERPRMCSMPYSEIADKFREQVRFEDGKLFLRATKDDAWSEHKIPTSDKAAEKGGGPRVLLKIIASAPPSTLKVELPLNDVDVVVVEGSDEALRDAERLGVTKDGIEVVKELDYSLLASSRDIDLNGCFLTKDGLRYSVQARDAAASGHVHILPAVRGLYGSDHFHDLDGLLLAKDRGLCRLVKVVAEGKANSFEIPERNLEIDLGIYWLVLAKRFAGKENAQEIFQRMFDIAQQLGATKPGETSFIQLADRMHEKYPFFDFGDKQLDEQGVVRWLSGKLGKQIEKLYRQSFGIYDDSKLERREGDHQLVRIELPPRSHTPNSPEFKPDLEAFAERCAGRSAAERQKIRDLVQGRDE